jgi:hypothetical protein
MTKVGPVEVPLAESIGPRVKYWAEAMQDLAKVEELYGVMAAALDEAYKLGCLNAVFKQANMIVDAEWEVVDGEDGEESAGKHRAANLEEWEAAGRSQREQAVGDDSSSGSTEPPAVVPELPGGDTEVP